MKLKRLFSASSRPAGLLLIVALAVCIWQMGRVGAADSSQWPTYELYRCQDCDTPASVDPTCPRRWACAKCGYLTWRLHRRFRRTWANDYPSVAEYRDAQRAAGIPCAAEEWDGSPVKAWWESY